MDARVGVRDIVLTKRTSAEIYMYCVFVYSLCLQTIVINCWSFKSYCIMLHNSSFLKAVISYSCL